MSDTSHSGSPAPSTTSTSRSYVVLLALCVRPAAGVIPLDPRVDHPHCRHYQGVSAPSLYPGPCVPYVPRVYHTAVCHATVGGPPASITARARRRVFIGTLGSSCFHAVCGREGRVCKEGYTAVICYTLIFLTNGLPRGRQVWRTPWTIGEAPEGRGRGKGEGRRGEGDEGTRGEGGGEGGGLSGRPINMTAPCQSSISGAIQAAPRAY